jgi:putative ABC transport system permease protein
MVFQFLKTTLRNLLKNKGYSFLNIFGLAIGIACAGLIFLWVENEMGYDNFNTKKGRIYFTLENQKYDAGVFTLGSTPGPLGPAVQKEIPGIANTCRASEGQTSLLFAIGGKTMYASGRYAEPSLFSMFTLPFAEGDPKNAFKDLYSLVITQKTALKFFGRTGNLIGKTLKVDNKQEYTITGVLKDIPENSSLQFEWVAPFEIWYRQSTPWAQLWGNNCLSTYIELESGARVENINKQLRDFVQKREPKSIAHLFLFAMKDWHLRDDFKNGKQSGGGQIQYVQLFSIIAWIILLIACINFMNLATARSEKRAKEVGVRKVLGANKKNLILQFIGEAMVMAILSSLCAVLLIGLSLPAFNLLVQKNLSADFGTQSHLLALFGITMVCGLFAGSYPSLYLSSFNPVFVLKGLRVKTGSASFIRKGLVVTQFAISITLIISTMIIFQQIQHVKTRDLGFNRDNLIELNLQGDIANHYQSLKNDLLNTGVVKQVALSDHTTIYGGNNTDGITWEGKPASTKVLISGRDITPEFISTSGIKLIKGRDLEPTDSIAVNNNLNVLVTESLEKIMGKGSALGKTLRNEGDPSNRRTTIVGVVNDYVYGNMYGKPDPVVFICMAPQYMTVMYLRTREGPNPESILSKIKAVMIKNNPAYPFQYRFVDDQFNEMFLSEQLIGKLARVFASLAILISCLGLFGLSAYTAERRTREIGIRKVLGANIAGITLLLSKDFVKLVIVSALLSFPAAWWLMTGWLQNYTYRISISWWIFIIAGLLALCIAILTISIQSIRAALMNPVRSLRTE